MHFETYANFPEQRDSELSAEMLTEFFDDVAPKVLDARHPFTFFVTAFSGLRVPRLASRSLPEKVQQTREAGRRFLERHEGER